jgi:hypothetical protein
MIHLIPGFGTLAITGRRETVFERFSTQVRCEQGHLYTTIWVPLASLKAVRLGSSRYQRCPVGGHWSRTSRVDPGELTPEEAASAAAVHDIRIP